MSLPLSFSRLVLAAALAGVLISGCEQPEKSPELELSLESGDLHLTSNWAFRSRTPIRSYFSQVFVCWPEEGKMEPRSGGRNNRFTEKTTLVRREGARTRIPVRETDYNRGRLCIVEVVLFRREDGTVAEKTFLSNVIDSPEKERYFSPPDSLIEEIKRPPDPSGAGL